MTRLNKYSGQLADVHKRLLDRLGGEKLAVNMFSPLYWSNIRLNGYLRRELPRMAEGIVLDIGCGSLPYARLYDSPRVEQAVAVDIGEDGACYAGTHIRPGYVCADANHLPIRTSSAQLAVLTSVVEHVPVPGNVLKEVARCLRPGGHLCMSVPFAYGAHGLPYDFWRPTPSGLSWLLENAGFRDIKVINCGGAAAALATAFCRWMWRKLRGTDATGWRKAILRIVVWPWAFPMIFAVNAVTHLYEALLPDSTLSPMLVAVARKPTNVKDDT